MLSIGQALQQLNAGQLIIYPTEGVYGIGCCPENDKAMQSLLKIKKTAVRKGFIVIAGEADQIKHYVDWQRIPAEMLEKINSSWPGPTTWIMPATSSAPEVIKSEQDTIAIRITTHDTVKQLCEVVGGGLVSTSANFPGANPPRSFADLDDKLISITGGVVSGELGGLGAPSSIIDALSGQRYR